MKTLTLLILSLIATQTVYSADADDSKQTETVTPKTTTAADVVPAGSWIISDDNNPADEEC